MMKMKHLHKLGLTSVGLLVLAAVLSACGALGGGGGNTLPTPIPGEELGEEARSQAKDSYQGTWDSYLRDSIAAANKVAANDIDMLERYELPSITKQNLPGTLSSVELVEDRTAFNIASSGGIAASNAEFDIRLTFANGDTDTRTCRLAVQIELDSESNLWFVINPAPLPVFNACG
jgi:hypothetical protein